MTRHWTIFVKEVSAIEALYKVAVEQDSDRSAIVREIVRQELKHTSVEVTVRSEARP